jgi:hypothetical protein
MNRICYSKFHIGPRWFGVKPPYDDPDETHGICPDCLPDELRAIAETVYQLRRDNTIFDGKET